MKKRGNTTQIETMNDMASMVVLFLRGVIQKVGEKNKGRSLVVNQKAILATIKLIEEHYEVTKIERSQ